MRRACAVALLLLALALVALSVALHPEAASYALVGAGLVALVALVDVDDLTSRG